MLVLLFDNSSVSLMYIIINIFDIYQANLIPKRILITVQVNLELLIFKINKYNNILLKTFKY